MADNFLSWNKRVLVSAWHKKSANIFIIAALDFLLISFLGFVMGKFLANIQKVYDAITLPDNLPLQSAEIIAQTAATTEGFYNLLIFSAVKFLIIAILCIGLVQTINWLLVAKIKPSVYFFMRLFALHIFFGGIWLGLSALYFIGLTFPGFFVLSVITLLILLYFAGICLILFLKTKSFQSISRGFALGIFKFHYFLIPLFLGFGGFGLLLGLIYITGKFITFSFIGYFTGTLLLVYGGFLRYYAFEAVSSQ